MIQTKTRLLLRLCQVMSLSLILPSNIAASDHVNNTSELHSEISKFQFPLDSINTFLKLPLKMYTNYLTEFSEFLNSIFVQYTNSNNNVTNVECSKTLYKTEENLLEIVIRELLNNMYLARDKVHDEKHVCNEVQNWLEYLLDKFLSKHCDKVRPFNYKLFDIIGVLCKETNVKVQYTIDNLKDLSKAHDVLIQECIITILDNDFRNADRKLKLITNDDNLMHIVKTVYNNGGIKNSENNFYLLVNFFSNIGNVRKSYVAYNTLYSLLENDAYSDGWREYKLYENLVKIKNRVTYPKIEPEATLLRENLKVKLISFVSEELIESYKDQNSPVLPETYILADIYRNFKDIYYDGVKMFLNVTCHKSFKCDPVNLMHFARRRNYHGEIILGMKAIYEELCLTDDETLTLGYHIHNISNIKYKSSQKDKLEKLKSDLPGSVRNLLFSKNVCIKNVAYNEYLSSNGNLVFTMSAPDKFLDALWKLDCYKRSQCRNTFYIKKVDMKVLHLHAPVGLNDYKYDPSGRSVIIVQSTVDTSNSGWLIEPVGQNCYIKSVQYNSYLYASDEFYDHNKRLAFIWIPNISRISSGKFQWFLEDCTMF